MKVDTFGAVAARAAASYGNGRAIKRYEVYFDALKVIAEMSTCPRRHVAAMALLQSRIVAVSYNGSAPNEPHCETQGCLIGTDAEGNDHCLRTTHAEENLVATAAATGLKLSDCYVLSSYKPCPRCVALLANAGVKNIYWDDRDVDSN